MDSSKIGEKAFSSLDGIFLIRTIITDDGISEADRSALEKAGIKIILAEIADATKMPN